MIADGGDEVVGMKSKEFWFELLAFADVNFVGVIITTSIFEKNSNLLASGGGPIMEINHGLSILKMKLTQIHIVSAPANFKSLNCDYSAASISSSRHFAGSRACSFFSASASKNESSNACASFKRGSQNV